MTLEEVARASGIPMATLLKQFPVPVEDRRTPLKELKQRYPFDAQAVRDYVQAYLNEHAARRE